MSYIGMLLEKCRLNAMYNSRIRTAARLCGQTKEVMMKKRCLLYLILIATVLALLVSGCGKATVKPSNEQGNPAGDIPDNQAFLMYKPDSGSFEVKVPEGWAQSTSDSTIEFTDKLNIVSIRWVTDAPEPTLERANLVEAQELASTEPGFQLVEISQVTLPVGKVILIKYHRDSAPSQVTGKTYKMDVAFYEFYRNGLQVNLTLASPVGADNVDPWKTISESFTWL